MDDHTPKLPPAAQARIEAERAKSELWFSKTIKADKTWEDFEDTLFRYILSVFAVSAEETYRAALDAEWPVNDLRKTISRALGEIIDDAFDSKHRNGGGMDSAFWKGAFRSRAIRVIRATPEWLKLQEALLEYAEWQAAEDTDDPPSTSSDTSSREALVDAFLAKCNAGLSFKVLRKHIYLAAGHKTPRQFQFWQAGDEKATAQDDQTFRRILNLTPSQFEATLKNLGHI